MNLLLNTLKSILPYVLIICASFCYLSCKKSNDHLLAEITHLSGHRLNDVHFINDSLGFVVGGTRDEIGYVWKTIDGGLSWKETQLSQEESAYSVFMSSEHEGWIGGGYISLYQTLNSGDSWNYQWLQDQVPFHEEDRPGIKKISALNDSVVVFIGGENYGEGIYYQQCTEDASMENSNCKYGWSFEQMDHELSDIAFNANGLGITAGYGRIYQVSENGVLNLVHTFGEYIKGLVWVDNETILAATINGKILRSTNKGIAWETVHRSAGFTLSDMDKEDELIVIVGMSGKVICSEDHGGSWDEKTIEGNPNLTAVQIIRKGIVATSNNGNLYWFSND